MDFVMSFYLRDSMENFLMSVRRAHIMRTVTTS